MPDLGYRGFTAHFRDPNRQDYFSNIANTSEVIRQYYPEVCIFFKGYFATENRKYMCPEDNSNATKNIFEDEYELTDIARSLSTDNY